MIILEGLLEFGEDFSLFTGFLLGEDEGLPLFTIFFKLLFDLLELTDRGLSGQGDRLRGLTEHGVLLGDFTTGDFTTGDFTTGDFTTGDLCWGLTADGAIELFASLEEV